MNSQACRICGVVKPLSMFEWGRRCCRACERVQKRAYARAQIDASRRWIDEFAQQWRQSAGATIDGAAAFIKQQWRGTGGKLDRPPHPYYRLRHEAIMAYGGYRCACCGEGEPMFLTLDHINNDGARDRREPGLYMKRLLSLRKRGYPRGFQVLCSNCNHGKHRNGGTCPHKTRQRDR